MQYLGGKHRIAKPLGAYLRSRLGGRYFVEPFCGALNITAQMEGPRLASDASPYLFTLYSALRAGWVPPEVVTEEDYHRVKERLDPLDPLTAFVGYGCSFGGKFFGGYALSPRADRVHGYAPGARKALLKKHTRCTGVSFSLCSYERLSPDARCLVYCDPPYAETTDYSAVGAFDSAAFWEQCRQWSKGGAVVLVSEYQAPPDFRCVWEIQTKTDLHGAGRAGRVERVFEYCPIQGESDL